MIPAMGIRHLYIHVPFCPHICPYCSFHVLPARREGARRTVDLLIQEHRSIAHDLHPDTIFLGGGTPTALSTEMLRELLAQVAGVPGNPVEFTSECNPSTLPLPKAAMMLSLGVNRISIGAQSFDSATLKILGRTHSADAIRACVKTARDAGFRNINLDLIFGVPGQTPASWRQTIEAALSLKPQHISCYGLTYEEDTDFFRRHQQGDLKSDGALEQEMFHAADRLLTREGFHHYEISNYALPGFESRHNQSYWRGEDYYGIGPSAVSTVRGKRITNSRFDGQGWMPEPAENLSRDTLASERMALGLRTSEGVDEADFASHFGFRPVEKWKREIQWLIRGGLMSDNPTLQLTQRGREVADEVATHFV